MQCLALFDFDGTLTYKDSLSDFIAYAVGSPRMLAGGVFLSPYLAVYTLKLLDNDRAKQKVLAHFFAGWRTERLRSLGEEYALHCLPHILRPKGVERMKWHLRENHEVVIVSASPEIWLRAWTEDWHVGLVGTKLEEREGRITGKYNGKNCHGEEKVRRIKARYDLERYDTIYAYGDTQGDHPMFALADEVFYKPFR